MIPFSCTSKLSLPKEVLELAPITNFYKMPSKSAYCRFLQLGLRHLNAFVDVVIDINIMFASKSVR